MRLLPVTELMVLGVLLPALALAPTAQDALCAAEERERLILGAASGDYAAVDDVLRQNSRSRLGDCPEVALGSAVFSGHYPTVRRLVEFGVQVDFADGGGATPLMYAAIIDRPDIARLLLQWGADPRARSAEGKTALNYATDRPSSETADELRRWSSVSTGQGIPRWLREESAAPSK